MPNLHCPVCEKTFEISQSTVPPFCSERCRLIDLGRWLDERNGLPYESLEEPEEPTQKDSILENRD